MTKAVKLEKRHQLFGICNVVNKVYIRTFKIVKVFFLHKLVGINRKSLNVGITISPLKSKVKVKFKSSKSLFFIFSYFRNILIAK